MLTVIVLTFDMNKNVHIKRYNIVGIWNSNPKFAVNSPHNNKKSNTNTDRHSIQLSGIFLFFKWEIKL